MDKKMEMLISLLKVCKVCAHQKPKKEQSHLPGVVGCHRITIRVRSSSSVCANCCIVGESEHNVESTATGGEW